MPENDNSSASYPSIKFRIREIIFEADTRAGKNFDVLLILAIILSTVVVIIESVAQIRAEYQTSLRVLEWNFTILFTIEYILRIYSVERKMGYITSFYGIVDLLSILPTYLSLLLPGTHYLAIIRLLRIIRVFRVLKLVAYIKEANTLSRALWASRRKIFIFLYTVMVIVIVVGSLMYVIEGKEGGFTSIPRGIYWAIVTLTTVGYGDIAPITPIGQTLASLLMITGYAIIAVPTGIVTAEMTAAARERPLTTISCPHCTAQGHDSYSSFCKYCGGKLQSGG